MAKARRTTHRSSTGTNLCAVPDTEGRFRDTQTYEQPDQTDLARNSKTETKH
jgi:hypothetical protein